MFFIADGFAIKFFLNTISDFQNAIMINHFQSKNSFFLDMSSFLEELYRMD